MTLNTISSPLLNQYDSQSSGILNTGPAITLSIPITSQSIAALDQYNTNSTYNVAPVSKALMDVRYQLVGLESIFHIVNGNTTVDFPGIDHYNVITAYELTGTNIKVYTIINNLTAHGIITPAFTVNLTVTFYLPPFN